MTRILHLVPGAPFGGAQRLAIDLAAHQRADGMDATILLLSGGDQARAAANSAGVPVADCGTGFLRPLRARKAIAAADILHLHMPPPWLGPALPAGPKKLLHLHVRPAALVHPPSWRVTMDGLGNRAILKKMDRVIAISEWIADAWRGEFTDVLPPISVIHNGIVLPQVTARPNGPFTIGVACRLSPLKGVEEFIALAKELHERAPDIRFRVAGDGPDRARYRNMADKAGLSDALQFEGFVDDMARFWASAHLCAFTPPFEPFGLRLIEPVGHGVPVAAYLTGTGSDEVAAMCRGIAGVPYADVGQMADMVLALRDDPQRLAAMASEGRADVEAHFALDLMARRVSEAYGVGEDYRKAAP